MRKIKGLLAVLVIFITLISAKKLSIMAAGDFDPTDSRDAHRDYGDDYTSWYVEVAGNYKSVAIELNYNGGTYAGHRRSTIHALHF